MYPVDKVERKFIAVFAMELRRQGVAQPSECEKQVRERLMVVETATEFSDMTLEDKTTYKKGTEANEAGRCSSSCACVLGTDIHSLYGEVKHQSDDPLNNDDANTKRKFDGDTRWTFELDLSGQRLGNKVVIALCETLLKLNSFNDVTVIRWHILLMQNGLTDQCIRHLCFIILFCPNVALLVVTENCFTKEGIAELSQAIDETEYVCEVHYDRNETQSQDVINITKCCSQSQELDRSNANSSPLSLRKISEAPPTSQQISASKNSPDISVSQNTSPHYGHNPFPIVSVSQLSRTATAISLPSCVSASTVGNAEALRRRREELFGKSVQINLDVMHEDDNNVTHSTINGASDAHKTLSPPQSSSSLSPQRFSDSIQVSCVLEEAPAISPFREERKKSETRRASTYSSESDFLLRSSSGALPSAHNQGSSVDYGQGEAIEDREDSKQHHCQSGGRPGIRPHEPFEDNEELDFTANLNPVVGSVLDLSRTVNPETSALWESHTHGDTQSVWDVIKAHEEASQQLYASGEVDQEASVKLPAAFVGRNNYFTITVLNLSGNHLKSMQALPATLLQLDISNNDLTLLNGLNSCTMLTVLNARRNRIDRITGLECNTCLAHVFLGRNCIKTVQGLAHLLILETLDLSHNQLRTYTAVRALSLCSSLRHLLLKGNPIVDDTAQGKGCYPMIRNLCPSLMMIDNRKLSQSRFAERLERQESYMRQPMLIDTTHQPRISFDVENGVRSVTMPQTGDGQTASRGDRSLHTSHHVTSSSRGTPECVAPRDEEPPENAVNLLYLLTHSATPRKGYSDAARVVSTVRHMTQREAKLREAEQRKRLLQHRGNANSLRVEMTKLLAGKSKKYLETTIVEHVTQLQQQQQLSENKEVHGPPDTPTVQASRVGDVGKKRASSRKSYRITQGSFIAKSPCYTAPPTYPNTTAVDLSKPYEPNRFCPPRHPLRAMEAESSIRKRTVSSQGVLLSPEVDEATSDAVHIDKRPGDANCISKDQCRTSDPTLQVLHEPLSYVQLYAAERALHQEDILPINTETDDGRPGCSPIRDVSVEDEPVRGRSSEILRAARRAVVGCSLPLTLNAGQPPLLKREELSASAKSRETHRISTSVSSRHFSPSLSRATLREPTREHKAHRADATPWNCRLQNEHYEVPNKLPMASHCVGRHFAAQDTLRSNIHDPMSMPFLHIDAPLHASILAWKRQIAEDVKTVQSALKAIIALLQTQRSNLVGRTGGKRTVPSAYLQERQKCVEIIQRSGMLSDTHVPKDVVTHYGFDKAELEGVIAGRQRVKCKSRASQDRMLVLQHVQMLGDAKTCLRYLVLLMDGDDESLLQDYVDQIKETFEAL
ncbi:unnamed protein product [Phytomonas sp. EM1]|nr:unnamed protein product [Phytomonas sp. EM1]|eukprot:CCW61466.1 unnamed protein product [Phytomonas sp. isolate EM1]